MGNGDRVHFVENDGAIRRISYTKFERSCYGWTNERIGTNKLGIQRNTQKMIFETDFQIPTQGHQATWSFK